MWAQIGLPRIFGVSRAVGQGKTHAFGDSALFDSARAGVNEAALSGWSAFPVISSLGGIRGTGPGHTL